MGERRPERVAHLVQAELGRLFLRGEVGRALGLRVSPELRFEYDTTPDTARRVDDLLRAGTDEEKEE